MRSQPEDLLKLFADEAEERIDRLLELIPRMGSDESAAEQVRRELHTLKGASRMLGLESFSALCHEGEEIVNGGAEDREARLLSLMDRLAAGLRRAVDLHEEEEARGEKKTVRGEGAPQATHESVPDRRRRQEAHEAIVRIPVSRLDTLADRAIRLRVLAVGASTLIERLRDLSRYAETSVNGPEPQQVLATLGTSLKRLSLELDSGQRKFLRGAQRQIDALLGFQLQPLRPFLMRLARHVRELASGLGKKVEVNVEGGRTELDRRIIEVLEEAMVHLVRNAVDHGIEDGEIRLAAGKPAAGTIGISAVQRGRMVELRVSDDGAGIDRERVLDAARVRGLLDEGMETSAIPDDEVYHLLFHPGFTTRAASTDVSGRGVGLDAVAAVVQRVGGQVWINSTPGLGTTVHVLAPISKRSEKIRVLQSGSSLVAVPAASVIGYRNARRVKRHTSHKAPETVEYEGRMVPLYRLDDLLGEEAAEEGVLVFMRTGGITLCVVADSAGPEEEVLLRPLPSPGSEPLIFDSAVLLPSGRPVPVLSPFLLSTHRSGAVRAAGRRTGTENRRTRVVLVDDSRVTREMMRGLLEDAGLSVVPASTAEQALEILERQEADCLVTDIEMPGMNGLELTSRLREDPRFADLPIIVVSTRNTEEDRLAGLDAGADAYLTKQGFDAARLIRLVKQLAR